MKRLTRVNLGCMMLAGAVALVACVDDGPAAPPLPGVGGATKPRDAGTVDSGAGGGAGTSAAGAAGAGGGTAGSAGSGGGAGSSGLAGAGTDAGVDAGDAG